MSFLVGAPTRGRAWILPEYIRRVKASCAKADVEPSFLFVVEEDDNDPGMIASCLDESEYSLVTLPADESSSMQRVWNEKRYEYMVFLRNTLLKEVRVLAPDLFLSLDTDMLLHEDAISALVDNIGNYDAIGGKAYLSDIGRFHSTYASDFALNRPEAEGIFPVPVIMAIKLMKPSAYNIDYKTHRFGEDLGYCENAQEAGLKFVWCGSVTNKHVMRQENLGVVDDRVGF